MKNDYDRLTGGGLSDTIAVVAIAFFLLVALIVSGAGYLLLGHI